MILMIGLPLECKYISLTILADRRLDGKHNEQ